MIPQNLEEKLLVERKRTIRLFEEKTKLKKTGTDVMLALEDCIDHFDDDNWPDDLGYSKKDLIKARDKYEQTLKEVV